MNPFPYSVRLLMVFLCLLLLLPCGVAFPSQESGVPVQPATSVPVKKVSLSAEEKAFLKDHPVIRLGVAEEWAPYVIRRPSGELEGFEVDLLQYLSAATGANLQLVAGRWKEAVEQAERHELDGLSMTVANKERAASFLFSESYLSAYPALVVSAGTPQRIDSIDALHGKTVAILAGHKFYRTLLSAYPEITVSEKPTEAEVIRAVVEGRAAAAIIATTSFDKYYKHFGQSIRIAYVATDKPLKLLYSIRKDWPELVSIINKGLGAIPVAQFNQAYYNWFGTAPVAARESSDQPSFSAAEQAWLSRQQVVRAYIGNYMPYCTSSGGQGVRGMAVDYLALVASRAGFRIEFVTNLTWSQALSDIRQHERVDLLPAAYITPQREEFLNFTTEYLKSPSVIYTRNDSFFVGSMQDLAGKTVAVERNYGMVAWLVERFPEVKQLTVESTRDALRSVAEGEADAYIGNLTVATYISRANGFSNLMIAAPSPFGSDDQAMGIRKDWPELAGIIDKTLASLSPEEHETIRARWLPPVRYEYGISRGDVLNWVWIISSILLAIIAVILIWNKKLAREVASRAAAEEALRESEEKYRILYRDSPDAYLIIIDGVFIDCNRATEVMLRGERSQITGQTPESLSPEFQPDGRESMESAKEKIKEALQTGKKTFEWVHRRLDGVDFDVEVSIAAMVLDGQSALFTTWRDITQRKRDEAERQRLETQLLHAQKLDSLGVMAGGIAHDLNNLLVPIIGCSDLALNKLGDAEHPLKPLLLQVQKAGARAADLVNQVLSFGRRQKLDRQTLDMNLIISDLQPMLLPMLHAQIELVLNLEPDLPQITGDQGKLEQVLVNLAINARDAMPERGTLHITTSRGKEPPSPGSNNSPDSGFAEHVLIQIIDNGHGMNTQTRGKIFEPYFSTKEPGKGSGLGLSMALGIVAQHGGSIHVESQLGEGTCVAITLPVTNETASVRPVKPQSGQEKLQGGETVMVVDDDDMVRQTASESLRDAGYRVIESTGGNRALEIFMNPPFPIDLVLTDMTMPHMSGQELAEQLSRFSPELPIVFMSGYSQPLFEKSQAGSDSLAFIQKPFTSQELLRCLRKRLG
jgi:PAS domain S-box-containing protein